ncbi:MAG: PEP-CTERM sorting domain-containing protein [Bryobacteraceae bacterium]
MLRTALVLAILVTVASLGFATPLTINYVSCTGCGGGSAPFYSSASSNPVVDFTFSVTDYVPIASLASVTVTFSVYDSGTPGNLNVGQSDILAQVPGDDVYFASFSMGKHGPFTPGSATVATETVSDTYDMNAILTEIQGNTGQFTVEIGQLSGNYFIKGVPTVTMDANYVPEPASFALIGFGLVGLAALRRKRSKR